MAIVWTLLSDTDDDGLFDDADILSTDVEAIRLSHGFPGAMARITPGATAIITCKNVAGDLYLEGSSPYNLRIGRWLQLQATITPTTYKVFTGVLRYVRRIDYVFVELVIETRFNGLEQLINLPMFEGVLISDIVEYLFVPNHLQLVHPLKHTSGVEYCFIDFSDIDSCYIHDALPPLINIEATESTLAYYGGVIDGIRTGTQHLQNLVSAEWGWLYEERDGTIRLKNRHTLILDQTVQRTFTDADIVSFEYEYGENRVSSVEATATPRLRELRTIWEAEAPRRVDDGETFQTMRFLADDGRVVGLAADTPVTIDFSYENVDGTARTDVTAVVDKVFATSAEIRFNYPGGGARFISAGSTLSSTALIQQDPVDVIALAPTQDTFRRTMRIEGLETGDVDEVGRVCNFVLQQNRDIRGWVKSITLQMLNAASFDLDLLDMIRVNSSSTGHNKTYRVIGWDYDWKVGSGQVTYRLVPDAGITYIVIDVTGQNLINTGSIAF